MINCLLKIRQEFLNSKTLKKKKKERKEKDIDHFYIQKYYLKIK
jgi:hypothetical protein